MRLGLLSYINSLPVTYALEAGQVNFEGTIVRAEPTTLNRMVLEGELDLTAVSSVAYGRHSDKLVRVPGFCLACDGAVQSVRIFSKVPWPQINNVWVTGDSETSRALLAALKPDLKLVDFPGEPELDGRAEAVLRIGDRALEQVAGAVYEYDLGERWRAETGLPMVFAVWVTRAALVEDAITLLNASYQWGCQNRTAILAEAKRRTGLDDERLEDYFQRLFFRSTAASEAGLERFFERVLKPGKVGIV